MSEENDDDKELEASQKRLDDAREKGEIVRSADLTTAAGYAGLLLAAMAFGKPALLKLGEAASVLLGQADRFAPLMLGGGAALSGPIFLTFAMAAAPFFLIPAAAALLCVVAQRALVFTPSKLAPKLNRISPIAGIKNKFGRKGLFEFAKSFVKLVVISILLGAFFVSQMDSILMTVYLDPGLATTVLMHEIESFLGLVLLIAALIGLVDYFWQRAEHLRSNRMSRKDMEEEHKSSEGDPHMKAKRRQKAYDIATNQMLNEVPEADVVIVNPTHYAVALKWSRSSGRAPMCVAKGVDEIAARIREKAAEAGVPIHSDPPTARALFATLDIGQDVQPDQYRAVAAAIRFSEAMRRKAKGRLQT